MKRRSFFKAAAGAAVAGPSMVKEAAAQSYQLAPPSGLGLPSAAFGSVGQKAAWSASRELAELKDALLKLGGIPQWKKDEIWRNAAECARVTPDVDSLRSVSLSQKVRMARVSAYQQMLKEVEEPRFLRIEAFKEDCAKQGIKVPW